MCACERVFRAVPQSDGPAHKCRLSLQDCIDANHKHPRPCARCMQPLTKLVGYCRHERLVVYRCRNRH